MEAAIPKQPEMTPIESSLFDGYQYDPDSRDLTLHFKNGGVYRYADVSADKVAAFAESASPGRFYSAKIKANHTSEKLK